MARRASAARPPRSHVPPPAMKEDSQSQDVSTIDPDTNKATRSHPNRISSQDEDVAVRRKSATQKDENHLLRQRQIEQYTCVVSREARDKRSMIRQGVSPEESPKKRKRVGFVDDELDSE